MNTDPTENVRRVLVAAINAVPDERAGLEKTYGKTWNTTELSQDFEVLGFMAPFVVVREKATGKKGSLMFQHSPRYYFGFQPD